jgi:hypothetical protein
MWAHTPILTLEKKVWRAVLTQAFEDAEMAPNEDETATETLECSRARQYLRGDNFEEAEHLSLVCEYAEIPADRVILWARRRYRANGLVEKPGVSGGADTAGPTEGFARSEKRELCSRTPQNPIAVEAVVAAEAPALFPTNDLEQPAEN